MVPHWTHKKYTKFEIENLNWKLDLEFELEIRICHFKFEFVIGNFDQNFDLEEELECEIEILSYYVCTESVLVFLGFKF